MPGPQSCVMLLGVAAAILSSCCVRGKACNSDPIVEALVVFDHYSWEAWERKAAGSGNTVMQEVNSIFYEASQLLQDAGVELRIKNKNCIREMGDIIPMQDMYNKTWVNTFTSLDCFIKYMEDHPQYQTDVALMIVGQDLAAGASNGIGGVAKRGYACSNLGVGLIEATYDMRMSIAIAHEVAHLLDAKHDGQDNTCNSTHGYLMTDTTDFAHENFVTWSKCSLDSMNAFLKSDKSHCLRETTSEPIVADRLGALIGGDETCVRYFGAGAFVTRKKQASVPMCRSLLCITSLRQYYNPENNDLMTSKKFDLRFTPPGLPCGEGKSCQQGECVEDSSVPAHIKDECLYGDIPFFPSSPSWRTCSDVYSQGLCQQYGSLRGFCCDTCSVDTTAGEKEDKEEEEIEEETF